MFADRDFVSIFAASQEERGLTFKKITTGVVVQLVRIHACHAWGRGFESRPFRKSLNL